MSNSDPGPEQPKGPAGHREVIPELSRADRRDEADQETFDPEATRIRSAPVGSYPEPRSPAGQGGSNDQTMLFDPLQTTGSFSVSVGTATRPEPESLGRLGDYELLSELGRGGMGVVYLARQMSLNRIVALKTVLSSSAATAHEILRFRNEAEAAANLRHPGIVAVYEVGEANGCHYYSMEYIEGVDLSRLIRENSLPGDQAATYVRQLADAVQYAHVHGVLHRDLKPSNVLLDSQGAIKITDFGLAKQLNANSQLTRELSVIGTPSYMPPEQAMPARGPVGPYSDIYALGAVLYELLTARPPFRADNPLETIRQVVSDEPIALRLLNPRIPPDLQTICLKCLEKEPSRRYDSAKSLAEELGRYLAGQPILARPAGPIERLWRLCKRHPREAALTGAIFAAVTVGSLGVAWQWRLAKANLDRATRNFNLLDKAADEMLVVVEEWVTRAPPRSDAQQEKLKSSLQLFEEFLREEPADSKARQRLAETHERVAGIRRLLGQLDETAYHYREAIAIYQGLNAIEPSTRPWLPQLANAWDMLGNAQREAERFDEAGDALEEAIKIQETLNASDPTPRHTAEFAKTLYNRGLLRFERNEPEGALQDFERSIETSLKAIANEPNNGDFRQGLARCHINLGVLFRDKGDNASALKQYDAAIRILGDLVTTSPGKNEFALELAQSHLNRGNLMLASRGGTMPITDDPLGQSRRSFEESVRLLEVLKDEYPNVPEYRLQLANALNGLGGVQQESGQDADAKGSLNRARDEFLAVMRLSGDSAEVRSRLGLTLANLARLVPRDQSQQRVPLLVEACEHQRFALQKTPDARPIKTYLRSHLLALSRAYLLMGDHAQGVESAEALAALDLQGDDHRLAAELIVLAMIACQDDKSLDEAAHKATAEVYADRAMKRLSHAVAVGAVKRDQLRTDERFAALRDRPDFQRLLDQGNGKAGEQATPCD